MALFKISKGSSANLWTSNASKFAREGSAWFTADDGKFYIDIAGDGTSTLATNQNRIPLNAAQADHVAQALMIYTGQKNDTFANEWIFDGSQLTTLRLGHSIYYVEGNTTGTDGAWTGTLPSSTSLVEGFTIAYKVGIPAAATTTLALSNGTNTFTHTVYAGITNIDPLTISVGTIIILTYHLVNGTGRWTKDISGQRYEHPTTTAVTPDAVMVGKDSLGHVVIGSVITPASINAVDKSGDTMTGHLYMAGATSSMSSNTAKIIFTAPSTPNTAIVSMSANTAGMVSFEYGTNNTNSIGYDGANNAFRPKSGNTTASIGTASYPFANVYATNLHGTADQVAHDLTIKLGASDTTGTIYNGSVARTFSITPNTIDAVDKNGDIMGGYLTLYADPTNDLHAVTKQYLDNNTSVVTIRRWSTT